MARYRGSSCRLCRREGGKLFLKGARCETDKCAQARRSYAPGQHGQRRSKLSNYGMQLREKQKVKRIYGILERQFRLYFQRAEKTKGVTGEVLLQTLERRLDNVIFRLCLAASRNEARQIVRHGHITIGGKKVDIPSYIISEGQEVSIKGKDKFMKALRERMEVTKERGVPKWLQMDFQNLKGLIVSLPKRADVGFPIKEQMIVELYSK